MSNLDHTDLRILAILQADGKLPYQELGEAVGLSAPAAFQRVRKLETAGVIVGYHARIDPQAAGKPLIAFVHVHPGPDAPMPQLLTRWRRAPAVLECHRLTGADRYLLKLRLENVSALSAFLDGARRAGCTVESELAVETAFERWVV
ncbi:MAG: Lrp/AsnC family transcriptional regulator [Gemmatimonadetes bacterium]|nr:Lrp/AsnC family transcriptional regulator [Gemmatimonadota bacterium]MBI2403980.1 Lrp/AsnC family transcriptional regulator [Gemmatimonadota bacterium]MBI2536301.1 Lrp/AsnC family transcriptional regulator [Gemmatimonadota bacterium]